MVRNDWSPSIRPARITGAWCSSPRSREIRPGFAIDTVFVARGRTEIDLTTSGAASDATLVQLDVALAKLLASRIDA